MYLNVSDSNNLASASGKTRLQSDTLLNVVSILGVVDFLLFIDIMLFSLFLFKLYAFMRQCLLLLTYYILLIFVTQFMFYLGEVKLFASTTLENVQHIQTSGFKVSGCIIRFRDEHLRFDSFVSWHNIVRNDNELMSDRC